MKLLPFKTSSIASIGIELEFQIINPHTLSLTSRAKDLIRGIKESPYKKQVKPEITQSMIEINTKVHHEPKKMLKDLYELQKFLLRQANKLNIAFCGGGTHPFQKWALQKIYPIARYKKLSKIYRHMSKQSTVFGQHIHIGCDNAEDALYLTHALARYVPQLIAISASSPFYQSIDTGYSSSRSNIFNVYPLSGHVPFLLNWREFSEYFYKMKEVGIVFSMKDFYWDIRPKPEYGTIEIRVCDTPLTLKKAVIITAYVQSLVLYLLAERPITITPNLYHLYNYNRFQATRYGFDGDFIDYDTKKHHRIQEDINKTFIKIEPYVRQLHNEAYVSALMDDVVKKRNDTALLRQLYKVKRSFPDVVAEQCHYWIKKN